MLQSEIIKEIKTQLEINQTQIKNGILNHQMIYNKWLIELDVFAKKKLDANLRKAQQEIVSYGLEQKEMVIKLKKALKMQHDNTINITVKNGVEERKFNMTTALNRAKKQNIITRTTPVETVVPSDESEITSSPPTPESVFCNPLQPQDLNETEFLSYFGLVTHEVYKEIQNKRAERKRRRTANPQFLYTKGWDISKRKRNLYLASNLSPPHTRQSVKKQNQGPSPPFKASTPSSPSEAKKVLNFNTLANFPSGLTIERITQARVGADSKTCNECKEATGTLIVCEVCFNGFHVRCHNRPLVQQPKHCPKCYKDLGISSAKNYEEVIDLTEKLKERQLCLEKCKDLTAEMTQLQDKHSQMTISLKNQDVERENLLIKQEEASEKIRTLVSFIRSVQNGIHIENSPPKNLPALEVTRN